MAILGTGFKVVTEFVFSADNAIMGAEKLNESVQKLSETAEDAVKVVSSLGIRYVAAFSGATGGVLGVLGNAIKASDKFRSSQIELANFMVANRAAFMGGAIGFRDAMEQSSFIMEKIVSKARGLGISPDALVSQTKAADAFLRPKGLSGDNLSNSIELARVSLKAAPALGVSSGQAQAGIQAGISGQLSKNTQFGSRLFLEAGEAISEATDGAVKDLKSFNKASGQMRLKSLIAGLDKLAGTADIVAARADTLGSRLAQLQDLFMGVGSILKPLGDALLPLIKDTLDIILGFLKKDGAQIIKQVAIFIRSFIKAPKEMLLDILQISKMGGDLSKAIKIGTIALFIAHLTTIAHILKAIPLTAGLATLASGIGAFILRIPILGAVIGGIVGTLTKWFSPTLTGGIVAGIRTLGSAILRMGGFIAILMIPLQGLSRAFQILKIRFAEDLLKTVQKALPWIQILRESLQRFIYPIQEMIEGWATLFVELLYSNELLDKLFGTFKEGVINVQALSEMFLHLWATFKGIIAGISAFLGTIAGRDTLTGLMDLKMSDLTKAFQEAMQNEFGKTLDGFRKPTLGPEGGQGKVGDNVTKMNVTMNNSFKEVLQPDRIAFTIADQLRKESANKRSNRPTTSAGRQAGAMD